PRCPDCPPGFLPLRLRRLLVLRASPSLDGGLLLLWLSLASRPSSSCTRTISTCSCCRSAAFSALRVAYCSSSSSRVMPPVYQHLQPHLNSYGAVSRPAHQRARIALISPDVLQAGKGPDPLDHLLPLVAQAGPQRVGPRLRECDLLCQLYNNSLWTTKVT